MATAAGVLETISGYCSRCVGDNKWLLQQVCWRQYVATAAGVLETISGYCSRCVGDNKWLLQQVCWKQ